MKSALNYMEYMGSFSILVSADGHGEERPRWIEIDQCGLLISGNSSRCLHIKMKMENWCVQLSHVSLRITDLMSSKIIIPKSRSRSGSHFRVEPRWPGWSLESRLKPRHCLSMLTVRVGRINISDEIRGWSRACGDYPWKSHPNIS